MKTKRSSASAGEEMSSASAGEERSSASAGKERSSAPAGEERLVSADEVSSSASALKSQAWA